MNHEAEKVKGRLFVLSAPSGSGKSTLKDKVLQRLPDLVFSVSYTTRKPRPGEIDGRDYNSVRAGAGRRPSATIRVRPDLGRLLMAARTALRPPTTMDSESSGRRADKFRFSSMPSGVRRRLELMPADPSSQPGSRPRRPRFQPCSVPVPG